MGTRNVAAVDAELQPYQTAIDARFDRLYQTLVRFREEYRQEREVAERRHAETMAMLLHQSKLKQPTVSQPGSSLSQSAPVAEEQEKQESDAELQEIKKEAGNETTVVVKPTVAKDIREDCGNQEVFGSPKKDKDQNLLQSSSRSPVAKTRCWKNTMRCTTARFGMFSGRDRPFNIHVSGHVYGLGMVTRTRDYGPQNREDYGRHVILYEEPWGHFCGPDVITRHSAQRNIWDPGIANGKFSKQHLEDKVFLGDGSNDMVHSRNRRINKKESPGG